MSTIWTLDRFAGRAGFEVVRADDEEVSDLVYRFRYHVYVALMGRRQLYADHGRRLICEPLDARGQNYLALKDGVVIGTIRRNTLDDPAVRYYAKVYRADLFAPAPLEAVSITTKLMMLPEHQKSIYPMKLIVKYAADSYLRGVKIDIIDCNKHLIEFFEKLAYFSYIGWIFHKEFGSVRPMFYALDSVEYSQRVGSPLRSANAAGISDGCYGGYELIRRLAQPPRNARIRALSEHLRTLPDVARRPAFRADPLRLDLRLDPAAGLGDAEPARAEAL